MSRGKPIYRALAVLLAAVVLAVLIYRAVCPADVMYTKTGFAMNSAVTLNTYCGDGEESVDIAARVFSRISELDSLISWRNENSETAKINAGGGRAVRNVDTAARLLENSLAVADASNGAFNPCVLPLTELWSVEEDPRVPTEAEIASVLPLLDYRNASVEGGSVTLAEGMGVDLGAVGKGAACDEAFLLLEESDCTGAVLSVGGSLLIYGERPDGGSWTIGVRDPNGSANDIMGKLSLDGGFVSTSGDYEKFFSQNGVSYHHIFDSAAGYPANSGLRSVTVVADSGWLSDALSTACFVLGREDGKALLDKYGAQGVFIDTDDSVYVTDGLRDRFTLSNHRYTLREGD